MVKGRILKKMGYLADQQGIINRYLREAGGWDSHLLKCRDYILDKLNKYSPAVVTVLGSGWLLDVPLEELAEKCNTINLVDINHPPQVARKVKQYPGVNLIKDDITGGLIEHIWKSGTEITDPSLVKVPVYSPSYDPGMVISLNVLTQTDTLISDYLGRKGHSDISSLRALRGEIQSAHLSFLLKHPSILITDYSELIFDKDALFAQNELLFVELPPGSETTEWEWDFDNSGEYYKRKRLLFKVMAIDYVKRG
ncbi:MAG: hypothetical protein V2I37_03420 [Marinilabiliaceae bacterium]|jgi:hypothetical protein|nr:hypothetical protein [Marinilabiliaceae bacterium]